MIHDWTKCEPQIINTSMWRVQSVPGVILNVVPLIVMRCPTFPRMPRQPIGRLQAVTFM